MNIACNARILRNLHAMVSILRNLPTPTLDPDNYWIQKFKLAAAPHSEQSQMWKALNLNSS